MIAVTDLSKDEIHALINAIPLDFARPVLKENSKGFNRLFPGSTIKKLNDNKMQKSFRNNYKDHFVQIIVESYLQAMKAVVDKKQSEFAKEGHNENDSFIMALSEEIKPELIAIYLRYYEIPYDQNLLSAINCYLNSFNKNKALELMIDKQTEQVSEIEPLKDTIDELKEKNNNLENAYQDLRDENASIRDSLKHTQEELMKIRSHQSFQIKRTIPAEKPYEHTDPKYIYSSLGMVYNYGDEIRLKRLRNIEGNMLSDITSSDDGHGFEFLYLKNGPTSDGQYGVWDWLITPNIKDTSREIALSNYNFKCQPISIILCSRISSFDDLLISLKQGIEAAPLTQRVLFVIPSESEEYLAVLCDDSDITTSGKVVRLRDNTIYIKKYIINKTDIIEVNKNVFFYKYISMPIIGEYVSVENSLEIVKRIIINQVTWNVAKQKSIERKDWQSYRNMVKAIPTNDIYREIMEKCMCDEEEAKRLISELERNAEHLMKGDDISYEILTAIVNNNNELMTKCEDLVEERWRKENQNLIDSEQTRLQLLKDECGKKQKESDNLELQLTTVKAEIEKYQSSIEEKEKLAADVEVKIALQIEKAKQNVADFISNMAFVSPLSSPVVSNVKQPSNQLLVFNTHIDCIESGEIDDTDSFEEELSENLTRIGFDDKQSIEISQAISFGSFEKIPLVISENAKLIAQCLAAVVNGGTVSEIFIPIQGVSIEEVSNAINNSSKSSPMVCLIHGVFDSYSINLFNAIFNLMQNFDNTIVLLALEGTPSKMIMPGVWNRAVFIDGDSGFEKRTVDSLHSSTLFDSFDLHKRTIDIESKKYKNAKKTIKLFAEILSNIQIGMYARYLSIHNISLNDSDLILTQLIVTAQSIGISDRLKELFHENGIVRGEDLFD